MNLRTPALTATALTAGVVLALAAPLGASAHVSVLPDSTAAGAYTVLTFSNAHGCEGSPTTGITIDIPKGIDSVSPTINPGWTAAKVMNADRVGQVTYTAETPLQDGFRTTFALSLQLPADAEGETLEFPVLQSCAEGETDWNQTAVDGEAEPDLPAPFIVVGAAADDTHDHSSSEDHAGAETGTQDTVVAETASTSSSSSDDTLARVLGVGGLVAGAIGIVLAVTARRKQA
ncbi:MAG: YcnI family protein [Cryobacterium sp.]